MNASLFFQFLVHGLCEWGAALAIVFWVAREWPQSPTPFLAGVVRNPLHLWLMVVFGIAPGMMFLLLSPVLKQLYSDRSMIGLAVPISFALTVVYGLFLGLAASCCVAPSSAQQTFRAGAATTVTAVMILASYALGWLLFRQFFIHALAAMAAAVTILFIARSMIVAMPASQIPPVPMTTTPSVPPRRLWPALVIGFLPSALFLITFAVAFSTSNLSKDESNALLWLCSGVSVVCCFVASILLFKRSTAGAITGGILFLLLNAFIGFFFGCCASFNGTSFH